MAFTSQERQSLVDEIVANSEFSEESLKTLTDNQLVALAEPTKLDELVNNAGMPPQLKKAMDKKKSMNQEMKDDDEEDNMEDDMEEDDEEEMPPKKPMTAMGAYGKKKGMSTNQWLASAPPEVRRLVANARQVETARRNHLVEIITANENCPLTADELLTRSIEDLETFAAMARSTTGPSTLNHSYDFTGAAGGPVVNQRSIEAKPLSLPSADYMSKK